MSQYYEESVYSIDGVYTDDADIIYAGNYGNLVSNKSIYDSGTTYITGVRNTANRNPVLVRYQNETITTVDVGTIDNPDSLNHQHPAILIINSYVYIFMVNGHGQSIKVWKSDTTDVTDGFTLHDTIVGDFGYCNPRLLDDGRVVILSRRTGAAPLYDGYFAISAVNDYTTWTIRTTTEANYTSSDNRHYPSAVKYYGSNKWHYFGVSLRNETTSPTVYFGQAMTKTQDFETFYSLDEGFSKDITVAKITEAEVEANCMIIGSNASPRVYKSPANYIVINDVLYGTYYDSAWKYVRIDADGTINDFTCDLTNIPEYATPQFWFDFYYNGLRLVFISKSGLAVPFNNKIYSCDFNFNNITFHADIDSDIQAPILPQNMQDVDDKYIIMGSHNTVGSMYYTITDNTYS